VQTAGLVHLAVSGEGGVGGVMEGLRTLEGHVDAILAQEEAYSDLGNWSMVMMTDTLACDWSDTNKSSQNKMSRLVNRPPRQGEDSVIGT